MNSYRELKVWQVAMELVLDAYRETSRFPDGERFGLVAQKRRSAVSVPSYIAEGNARPTKEYIRFLTISRGSQQELETQIEISIRLHFLNPEESVQLLENASRTGRLLNSLIRSLHNRS